jgi:Cdc6-like AAA superfamily ATPase
MKINFNLASVGKDIAILKNNTTKKEKPIHVSESTEDVRNPFEIIEAEPNETIQLTPSSKDERSIIYVVGRSGSGKSYWTTNYVKEYLKKFKKNKVYLISPISDDKNINSLKPIRINPNSVEFYNDPPVCEDFKNSILICDDIEAYDKKQWLE